MFAGAQSIVAVGCVYSTSWLVEWPCSLAPVSKRLWMTSAIRAWLSESAARQLRMSPGGTTLNSARSLPELPPSSEVATIATRRSRDGVPERSSPYTSGRSPRSTFGRPVPPPMATIRGPVCIDPVCRETSVKVRAPGCIAGLPDKVRCRCRHERRAAVVGTRVFDEREHFAHRPPVVVREVDLDPGEPAGADGVQRMLLREGGEGPRRPVAQPAPADEAVHDLDEGGGALSAKLDDTQVLAVRLRRVHLLGHVHYPAVTNLDLHFFVAIGRL